MKIKKYIFRGGGSQGGVGYGVWLGGQVGFERRIEVFVKIKKKSGWVIGSGVGFGRGSEWMSSQVKFYSVLILNKES